MLNGLASAHSRAYDSNGNTTSKTDSTGTTTYTRDFENRLSSVTLPGTGGTVSFKYDPFGRRIYKSSPSATSVYAYDGDNLIEETSATGTAAARYTTGLNIDEPLAILQGTTTDYYQADGLGSITSLANSAGANAETYTYDSFGNLTASTGSLTNRYRFTGREFDSETGLYFYRARQYDSSVGRFLSEDPMRYRAGVNFYSYVFNNPTRYTDPTGECPQMDSVSRWHMQCEQSAKNIQLSKDQKCACHCVYAPEAPPGQGCIDVCMDCYAKSPTPYDACLCFAKRLAGRTKEQAESDCSLLKKRKWWWPW